MRGTLVSLVAVALLLSGAAPTLPLAVPPPNGGVSLSGRIFQSDGTNPYQGATVRVTNQETGEVFTAQPTDATGNYKFEGLPAGTYTFEVEVPEGIYKLDRAVRIGDSATASISFTVKPEDEAKEGAPPPDGGKLSKGALIAIILGGAALVAVAASGGSDNQASPSMPTPPTPPLP